jgi:voltage-gated sodium channel
MAVPSEAVSLNLQQRARQFIESKIVINVILGVILFNAMTLGMATSSTIMGAVGPILEVLDDVVIGFFVIELSIKFFAYRWRFFLSGWNIFDLAVVGFTLLPATGNLSVLRALRILRAMRLLSVLPQMREVVQALLNALPGMASVLTVLGLVYYIFAVMGTRLFGQDFPQWFGTLGESFYSLFQIMTLESWSMGIVRPVMEVYPLAWLLFVPFIMLTSFAVLNLFIGLMVNSMQSVYEAEYKDEMAKHQDLVREESRLLMEKIEGNNETLNELREENRALVEKVEDNNRLLSALREELARRS